MINFKSLSDERFKVGSYKKILKVHAKDKGNLLEIIRDVQAREGYVSEAALSDIADYLDLSEAEVKGVASFYHFFSLQPRGRTTVYLDDSITSRLKGRSRVASAFEEEAGCRFGQVTADGAIGLFPASCIGMNDQEPAALINGLVFTDLTPDKARVIVRGLKNGKSIHELAEEMMPGRGQSELFRNMAALNIRQKGPVLFAPFETGSAVRKIASLNPGQVIDKIKCSTLLGRGGAGFPTGLKWEICRNQDGPKRFIFANADEGEPGTFKDRVILTEIPQLVFEGMAVAGYAVGAEEGILYLRAEYAYLRSHLEAVLDEMRRAGVLGKNIAGNRSFNFDVKIKMGAGAYICGEESALIESAEGKRGDPRDRPPYPVQVGYLGRPTTVNNVETLAAAARIIVEGACWFKTMGTIKSAGTKLLSVSGDCARPGVFEVEFGIRLEELLNLAGADRPSAVQVGGPSGTCVAPAGFNRKICFEDLATGGSVIIFGPGRDIFQVVENFMDFFIEESCGRCTPCRVGNTLMKLKLGKIIQGRGTKTDLRQLEELGKMIKATSRCGLGQSSPNPILTTMENFPELYQARLRPDADFAPDFDFAQALKPGCQAAGRECPETEHEDE